MNFDNHPIFKIHNWLLLLSNVAWTDVPNILDHHIFVNLGCILNFSFLGNVEVRKIDVLRVGGSVAEPMCWVGRLRSLCVGWVVPG